MMILRGLRTLQSLCQTQKFCIVENSVKRTLATHAGLFSIKELQVPSDFAVLSDRAVQNCNKLRHDVAVTVGDDDTATTNLARKQDAVRLLHLLDDISKEVCNVIDAAELCRNVHASQAWRDAASDSFSKLSDYIGQLNGDTTLYRALQLVNRSDLELDDEDKRFAKLLQAEFERDGIHLDEAERDNVRLIQNEITQLESSFSANLVHSSQHFDVEEKLVLSVLPASSLHQLGVETTNDGDGKLRLSNNDSQLLQTLLKYSSDPKLRREIYMEYMTSVPENLLILEELRKRRHQLAIAQGFETFAQRTLIDKMAGTSENVFAFLDATAKENLPAFKRDMGLLSAAKQKVEGSGRLDPWDVSFYTSLVKARDGDLLHEVAQHLTLSKTVHGMQMLVQRIFGIEMKEVDMHDDERWDMDSDCVPQSKCHRLLKFSFSDSDGRDLGILFLDLHPRQAKYGHAAHFTVRCGCAIDNYYETDLSKMHYQTPIVALVCNLSQNADHDNLSHNEVETLFHEFGHGLHSLLSRTKFQHMSGTRCAMDFVETPSHLLENFVWDETFLQVLSSSMPDELVTQLQSSRYEFSAIERQTQLVYASFDQHLFGGLTSSSSTNVFADLHESHGVLYAKDTHWHSRFGHLVSYGASYYAYLYSQVFAGKIWKQCFAAKSLSRSAGHLVWRKMLIHGGARDPKVMIADVLRSN